MDDTFINRRIPSKFIVFNSFVFTVIVVVEFCNQFAECAEYLFLLLEFLFFHFIRKVTAGGF